MGLRVDLYRAGYNSSNNLFNNVQAVTLINVDGPFDPEMKAPAAVLTTNSVGDPIVRPYLPWFHVHGLDPAISEDSHFAMGGAYASTSDSRLGESLRGMNTHGYFAVPVHDYSLTLEAQRCSA